MDNSYQYSYQIIDQVYSLYCLVLKDEQNYEIDFTSNIEMKEEVLKNKLHLEMLYSEDVFLEEDVSNSIMYSSLESEEREGFELSIGEKIEPLREFIEQYKESINQVND